MEQTQLVVVMCFLLLDFIVFIWYLIVEYNNKEEPSTAACIFFIIITSVLVFVQGYNISIIDIALEYPAKEYTMKRKIVTIDNNADTTYFFERNIKTN